jgi:ElaB/YqjD/DUF883 family membrane-anchored ribosome-binding protein
MNADKSIESTRSLAEQATQSADAAIAATQRVVSSAVDGLTGGAYELNHKAAPLLQRAGDQAATLAQRGLDSVRDGSRRVRDSALDTTEHTLDYIRAEPVKAVLIAAATGAALMAVGQMMAGHASRRD